MKFLSCFLANFLILMLTLNVNADFEEGIMNVTLNKVEGLAEDECYENSEGFTECPDMGETIVTCKIKDDVTGLEVDGEMDFCMSFGSGCAISPCYNN